MKISFLNTINTDKLPANNTVKQNTVSQPVSIFGTQQTKSIESPAAADEPAKAEKNEKTEKDEKLQKEKEAKTERINNLADKCSKKLFDQKFGKNCELLEKSKFSVLGSLSVTFKSESKAVTEEIAKIFGNLMSVSNHPDEITNSKIDEMSNEIKKLQFRAKNLSAKAEKSVNIDKKLNNFVNKGGDINKINLDKLNEDILESLKSAETDSVADNSKVAGVEANSSSTTADSKTDDNEDIEPDEKQKEIDKRIDEFIALLEKGDPKEIENSKHEYIIKDEKNNSADTNSTNPFLKQKKKNPFITTQMPLS